MHQLTDRECAVIGVEPEGNHTLTHLQLTQRYMDKYRVPFDDAQNEAAALMNKLRPAKPKEVVATAPLYQCVAFPPGMLGRPLPPEPQPTLFSQKTNALRRIGMTYEDAQEEARLSPETESAEALVERVEREELTGERDEDPTFNPYMPNPGVYPEESKRQAYMGLVNLLSQLLMARSAEGRTEVIRAVSNQNLVQTLRGLANGVVSDRIVVERWADGVCSKISIFGGRAYGEAHQMARRFIKELEDAANRFPGP